MESVAVFVRDHATVDHRTRVQAFEEALGKIAESNPDDMEASILHALVTSAKAAGANSKSNGAEA